MITIYGIKNCSTIKEARTWLKNHAYSYHFHDYKEAGLEDALLDQLIDLVGLEKLINKRSTTWRHLTEEEKISINTISHAKKILEKYPTLIKRPILQKGKKAILGFKEEAYQHFLAEE